MGRVIADGLSEKARKNLDEIDAQGITINGEDVATEGYADTQADAAESAANSYTDSQTSNSGNWDTAYDRSITGVSGSGNGTLTINQQVGSETTNLAHSHGYSDLPSDVATESYADTQASNAESAAISSANGYTDSEIQSLDTSLRNYVDSTEGTLQSEIDDVDSDLQSHKSSSDHDDRYYTQSEVDALLEAAGWNEGNDDRVGCVEVFADDTTPNGYLKANGAEVSRNDYSRLFARIGTQWGSGDGSTTFNLPDLRGEFMRYWDDGRGVDDGRSFGSSQLDQMQKIVGLAEASNNGGLIRRSTSAGTLSGAFTEAPSSKANAIAFNSLQGWNIQFDSSLSPDARTSSTTDGETRPRNVALAAFIKY